MYGAFVGRRQAGPKWAIYSAWVIATARSVGSARDPFLPLLCCSERIVIIAYGPNECIMRYLPYSVTYLACEMVPSDYCAIRHL